MDLSREVAIHIIVGKMAQSGIMAIYVTEGPIAQSREVAIHVIAGEMSQS